MRSSGLGVGDLQEAQGGGYFFGTAWASFAETERWLGFGLLLENWCSVEIVFVCVVLLNCVIDFVYLNVLHVEVVDDVGGVLEQLLALGWGEDRLG